MQTHRSQPGSFHTRCGSRCGRVLLAGVCLAASPMARGQGGTPTGREANAVPAAGEAMRSGIAAANRNDLPAARRFFSQAVSLAPRVAGSHAALGAVLLAQGDLLAAERELTRAHQLAPADPGIALNLARTEETLGHAVQALRLFEVALWATPRPHLSDDETVAYAAALRASGQPKEASAVLDRALAETPESAPLLDAQGTLLASEGQFAPAMADFTRALGIDPGLAMARFHLGTALLATHQPKEAVAPLRAAVDAMPSSFEAHLQLGRALSALHDDAQALAELHRAVQLQPSELPPETAFSLALAMEASGDFPGSLPLFARALAADPPLPGNDVLINAALAHVQTGDATGALPLYAKALAEGPDTATLREDFGVAFLQKAELDAAIQQFRAGLALDPGSAHLHYDLGLAYKLKDDLPGAVAELERAAALDPSLPDPAYTLGILYMQQGRSAESISQLRRATTLQPANGEAWAVLAGVLKDAGSADTGDALAHAIALEPDQPSLHIQMAAVLAHQGDAAGAAAQRKIAAELSRQAMSQQRARFAVNSGRSLLADGKLQEAVEQLLVATQAEPRLAEAHRLLSEAYARQGRPADAAVERQLAQADAVQAATAGGSGQPAEAPQAAAP